MCSSHYLLFLSFSLFLGAKDYLQSKCAVSVEEAVSIWLDDVKLLGHSEQLVYPKASKLSFDGFVDLCSTIDGI
jgi:hypothetical protein